MASLFEGVIKPMYLNLRYVRSRAADNRLGIVTTDECITAESSRKSSEYCTVPGGFHRALSFTGIRRLMRRLNPAPHDVLLDIGSGAGRVISLASQYAFSRVIGVEIDETICALAQRNAHTLRRCIVRPEVICADAADYTVPDDVTVVFLYNPFGGEVLRSALTRVLESYDRRPRRIRLVYANPREHPLVMSMIRFRESGRLLMSWRPGAEWRRTQLIRFYEVEPRR
jgi:SAM-dependent methyltransferase